MSSLPARERAIRQSTMTSDGLADDSLCTYSGNIEIGGNASVQFGDNFGIHHHYHEIAKLPQQSDYDRDKYGKLLKSLNFDRMDARLRNVATALPNTCTWIFYHEKFMAWNDESRRPQHNGFLWIKGKPGCGKSTIVKTTLGWTRKKWPANWVIVSYFFNARAPSALEKSSLGLYQSVTHQLLSVLPGFRSSFVKSFSSKIRTISIEAWSASELQEFLVEIAERSERPPICLFVDALDEGAEDDVREMIEFLEDISSRAASSNQPFRVFLSSRHYPNITTRQALYLTVEDELEHERDIQIYIDKKLRVAGSQGTGDLRKQLICKSGKIFVWVIIVVAMLNKAYDRGGGLRAMSTLLKEIPTGMNNLYSEILNKNTDCFDECVTLLRWVLFSMHPLSPQELYLAVLHTSYTDSDQDFREEKGAVSDANRVQRCILNWSRGLVEITKADALHKFPIVQFIHETVRDYVLYSREAFQIVPDLSADAQGASHEILRTACVNYLTSERLIGAPGCLRARNANKYHEGVGFPFAGYSACYTLYHADTAQQHQISQRSFLLSQVDSNSKLLMARPPARHDMTGGDYTRIFTNGLLYFIAEHNLQYLAQVLVKESVDSIHGGMDVFSVRTPLQIARQRGSKEVAQCLTERAHWTDKEAALRAACSGGFLEMVRPLQDGGVNVNMRGGFHGSALQVACERGYPTIVKLLLDRGADANARAKGYDQAIYTASSLAYLEIIELLLDRQVDVKAQGGYSGTAPIAAAGSNGPSANYEDMARLLIDRGADVKARNSARMNALWTAARNGRFEYVQIFLDAGTADLPGKTCDEVEVRRAPEFAQAGLADKRDS